MFTYVILDHLPAVPEHFNLDALAMAGTDNTASLGKLDVSDNRLLNASVLPQYVGRTITVDGQQLKSAQGRRFRLNADFETWVKSNIHPEVTDAGVCFTSGSQYHGVHTDQTRDYVLIYVLEPGGDSAETVFYQEQGHPIWRRKSVPMTNVWINDYDTLTEIDRAYFPRYRWVLLNGDVLHGVENLTGQRISYQIGFNNNIFFSQL
jgi:hypothetical protein